MTTVRGITSRVDVVWRRNNLIVYSKDGISISTTTKDSLVHTDWYTITQLNTSDNGVMYQCEVVINASPKITINRSIILDIAGKLQR